MSDPIRLQLLEIARDRLRTIVLENFEAPLIVLGEVSDLGPEDPDVVIAIVPGEDVVRRQGRKLFVNLPIECQAIVKVDVTDPHRRAEECLAAIKRAFEVDDLTFGGLVNTDAVARLPTRVLPREPGTATMGIGIGYALEYQETWGAP